MSCQALHPTRAPVDRLVLVGTAASRFAVAPVAPEWHARDAWCCTVNKTTPCRLASVMDWARPQSLPDDGDTGG
jgi:uncharacterized protein